MSTLTLTLGHSPDPDDVLVTYPILSGLVRSNLNLKFVEVELEIEILNKLTLLEKLDVSAISVYTYLKVFDRYSIIPYGTSTGYRYGPKLVLREVRNGMLIAVPGLNTTASALAQMYLSEHRPKIIEVPYDKVSTLVKCGIVDGGVLIHEEQLTVKNVFSQFKIVDLGEWWYEQTRLPIPLGVNVVRKTLSDDVRKEIARLYREAIRYSLTNLDSMLLIAQRYSRLNDINLVRKFVLMYVRDQKISNEEVKAIEKLYEMAIEFKLVERDQPLTIDIVQD